ncbi:MAG: hypothetical protein QE263_09775 [Vampirovibrionales bacterium]|nr:hypothetical protein [Vampirovibrionales bacterium]
MSIFSTRFLQSSFHTRFFSGLVLLAMLLLPLVAFAVTGFGPNRYPNPRSTGIGVFFAPKACPIYATPSFDKDPIEWLRWDVSGQVFSHQRQTTVDARRIFLAFYPAQQMALLPVVSDNGVGWAEIQVNATQTAWVPLRSQWSEKERTEWPTHWGEYQTWLEFMRDNAPKAGILWLSGVPEFKRSLHMEPDDAAKLVPIELMRNVTVRHVRGDWMLLEVLDFNRESPMGWVRWRDDQGQLMAFPNLAKQRNPYVMGAR